MAACHLLLSFLQPPRTLSAGSWTLEATPRRCSTITDAVRPLTLAADPSPAIAHRRRSHGELAHAPLLLPGLFLSYAVPHSAWRTSSGEAPPPPPDSVLADGHRRHVPSPYILSRWIKIQWPMCTGDPVNADVDPRVEFEEQPPEASEQQQGINFEED
ncbi:hypothetical protein U9M48_019511, partial [Paspalum notatum var. saurae]